MNTTKQDPRNNNIWFDSSSPGKYWKEYKKALQVAIDSVNPEAYEQAILLIQKVARAGNTIFVCGNGGSAAIAEHLTCDWTKGASGPQLRLKTNCLSSNSALMTAIANDFSFDDVFAKQLQMLGHDGDLLITISSSGNSPNILKATQAAKAMYIQTIGFNGFTGGQSKLISDISLHVDYSNYAIVEDAHQALMQSMAQYIYRKLHT